MTAVDRQGQRLTAALAEFQALRAEIVQRIQSQQALYALCVLSTAGLLGASLAGTTPHTKVLLCVPFVASAIGLAYADHTRRIFYIAMYIGNKLWPQIDALVDGDLPSWEGDFASVMTTRTPFQAILSTAYISILFVLMPLTASVYAASAEHWRLSAAEWILWSAGVAATFFYIVFATAIALRFGMERDEGAGSAR